MSIFQRQTYLTPGIYRETVVSEPAPELQTGVPVFLGLIRKDHFDSVSTDFHLRSLSESGIWLVRQKAGDTETDPQGFCLWSEFQDAFSALEPFGYLVHAVRGFFENGGTRCFVQIICFDDRDVKPGRALGMGLDTCRSLDTVDLVCAPDIMWSPDSESPVSDPDEIKRMQAQVLRHCQESGDRFAILDSLPNADEDEVTGQCAGLKGSNGALYYPWIRVLDGPASTGGFIPPCGHVAGVYARSDEQTGVHKAPANEVLHGVLDLETVIDNALQGLLNPTGVNCLRVFPGRGILIWGARTVSGDPAWRHVNIRRVFITLRRWIELNMSDVIFEANDQRLWARIRLEITGYLNGLFEQGGLKGKVPEEAFYIKCDQETNPTEVRDAGMVVTEIGIAPAAPCEFIVIRIIQSETGMDITGDQTAGEAFMPEWEAQSLSGRGTGDVRISYIEYTTPGRDVSGEYVVIQNKGTDAVDMGNWTLTDRAAHTFRFPEFVLNPGDRVRVWTRAGTNTSNDLFWGSGIAIWNNEGDTATLCDREGNVVNRYKYLPHEEAA